MKAIVDQDLCTGCGLCATTCPDVFEMDGDTARIIGHQVPLASEESCLSALDGCPVAAISLEE